MAESLETEAIMYQELQTATITSIQQSILKNTTVKKTNGIKINDKTTTTYSKEI